MTKQITLSIAAIFALHGGLPAEEGFKPIFNGEDLSGWKSIQKQNGEASGGFGVDKDEKAIHTYIAPAAGSKQDIDCLYSENEYSSYVLKLEYKWLEKRFAPRIEHDRDGGLLFHLHGDLETIWPKSVEMQFGESEVTKVKDRYVTGDLWVIGEDVEVMNERNENEFYEPGADPVAVGKDKPYDKSFIPVGNEKPHGEWNQVTLTVRGSAEAIFEINGKIVNRVTDMTREVDGSRVPLEKGRIGLQAEFAEMMYRNIRIKELATPAE